MFEKLRVLAGGFFQHGAAMAAVTKRNWRPIDKVARLNRNACIVSGYTRAQFLHPANAFMTKDDRERHNTRFTRGDMNIAAANTADNDADQRAARFGIDNRHIPSFDLIGRNEHACFTGCHILASSPSTRLYLLCF
jgi:hypothetical protein